MIERFGLAEKVTQFHRAEIKFILMDQWEELSDHLAVGATAGGKSKLCVFTDDHRAITVTHPAAPPQRTNRLSIHFLKIRNAQFLMAAGNAAHQKRAETAPNEKLSIKFNPVSQSQSGNNEPGNNNGRQR
jgi:hypothetical protein